MRCCHRPAGTALMRMNTHAERSVRIAGCAALPPGYRLQGVGAGGISPIETRGVVDG